MAWPSCKDDIKYILVPFLCIIRVKIEMCPMQFITKCRQNLPSASAVGYFSLNYMTFARPPSRGRSSSEVHSCSSHHSTSKKSK